MRKSIFAAFMVLFSSATSALADPQIQASLIGNASTGPSTVCPQTVSFAFAIRSLPAQSLKVTYRFIRSDGATSAISETVLGNGLAGLPGYGAASYKWTLGGPTLPTYSGWVKIQVLTPQAVTSPPQTFTITCAKPAKL